MVAPAAWAKTLAAAETGRAAGAVGWAAVVVEAAEEAADEAALVARAAEPVAVVTVE